MTSNAKLTLFISSLFLSNTAIAGGPNIVNNCAFKGVNHPENANAVMFDEECENAYVLPPEVGKVTVSAVQQNLNLGFCSTLKIDQESVKESATIRKNILKKINKMIKELDPLDKEKEKLYEILSIKKIENEEAYVKFEEIKVKEEKLGKEVDDARSAYEKLLRKDPNSTTTAEAKKLLEDLVEDYTVLLDFKYYPAEKAFKRASREVKFAADRYDYTFKRFDKLSKSLKSLQTTADYIATSAQKSYEKYALLEGLSANLLFNTDTANLVQKYQEMNKNLNITWQPMLIKNAFFNAFLKENDTTPDSSFSALIDASIPGVSYQTLKNLDPNTPLLSLNEKESKQDEFFGSASGKVRLNLLGGCTYYDNVNLPVRENDINNISANMALNVN